MHIHFCCCRQRPTAWWVGESLQEIVCCTSPRLQPISTSSIVTQTIFIFENLTDWTSPRVCLYMKLFWWSVFAMLVWRQTKKTLVACLFLSKSPKPSGCLLVWWMEEQIRPSQSAERASFYDAFHCFHLFTSTKRAWAAALQGPQPVLNLQRVDRCPRGRVDRRPRWELTPHVRLGHPQM